MPKISVIVPVYNTEQYLPRCIDSILAQAFVDFELLLIDDGSKDNSGKICDEYAAKNSRIRVFHKENGGVSSARNIGLDNAQGEWITFVDSDDYVKPIYLDGLIEYTKKENVDLVVSFSISLFKDKIGVSYYNGKSISREDFDLLFTEFDFAWRTSPWGKLYKLDIIKQHYLAFKTNMPIGEDLVFLYEYLTNTNAIHINGEANYYYNADCENSLTKKINDIDIEFTCFNTIIQTVNNLTTNLNINRAEAIQKINQLIYIYTNRVLNSLYHTTSTYRKRISILKSIDFQPYLSHIKNIDKKANYYVTQILITNKSYRIYDLLRKFKTILKKLL